MLSIWFPRLASEISLRKRPLDGPFALTLRSGNADHLHCLNPTALTLGLQRGMALADARALCPDLATRPADLMGDRAALQHLRRWVGRYGPLAACDGADGLMVDITGVAHLFGGEAELRDDLMARLDRLGLTAACAIAETRGAAHALARFGQGQGGTDWIVPEGGLATRLAPLPIAALRVDHATADALSRLGLTRVGDLLSLPRAPLARRFGQGLVLRLDQALGVQPEPLSAEAEVPHFGVRLTLPEPIGRQEDVMAGLDRLLQRLCADLARHQRGARRLRLELRRVDGQDVTVEIGLARPLRDPGRIATLFARHVDEVEAGHGIDALRLYAPLTESLPPEQLGERAIPRQEEALADLMSSVGNRIGFDRVQRLLPAESLIPERSFQIVAAAYARAADGFPRGGPPRPATLFPPEPAQVPRGHPPASFRWRRMAFTTLRAIGPERIAPEWWLDDPAWRTGLRDYWRIETHQGPRLWLFHTPQAPAWCVQGEFP